MRVLFVVRPSASERAGGDLTQALFTKRALEGAGVRVDVAPTLDPDANGYDVAHVFGVFDPSDCERQMAACRRSGARIALSPIWWDLYEFAGRSRSCERILAGRRKDVERKLESLASRPTPQLFRRKETKKYEDRLALQTNLMRAADVLLPNSNIEAHFYRHRLRLQDRPIVVVHHAAEIDETDRNECHPDGGHRDGVLCVARIEQKKNQAMLLYALQDTDVSVTLAGACYEPSYLALCKKFWTPRVNWLGSTSRLDVLKRMTKAAVHVLPSWAETPGIASLEAAIMGARVVVSSNGTECEYFGERASYVDPENPRSIRTAVLDALALPPRQRGDALSTDLSKLTLHTVAERTLAGYRCAG